MLNRIACGAVAMAALSTSTLARDPVATFRDTLSIPFTAGSGNSNTNFSIVRDTDIGFEMGIKAKERFFGDANVGGAGSLYIVQPGFSPVSNSNPTLDPPRAWWNFDLSVNLGSATFNQIDVTLSITNNINSQSMSVDISALMIGFGLGGASVLQDSQNLGFGFFSALGFNANQPGTYSFLLSASAGTDSPSLGETGMTVRVLPMPHAAGLGLLGLSAVAGIRRRR